MSNISLDEVTSLARELTASKEHQDAKANELKQASERVKFIQDVLLPATLREVGLTKFTLEDGRTLSVEPQIATSISVEAWPEAEQWLIANQCDGIIKNQLIAEFDKGQNEVAETFASIIEAMLTRPKLVKFINDVLSNPLFSWGDFTIDREELLEEVDLPVAAVKAKKTIHHQTLGAFVRKCMSTGIEVPEGPFGIFVMDTCKITEPK